MRIRQSGYEAVTAAGYMEALLAKHRVPGCTLAVIRAGEILFSGAYGVRNSQGTPMAEGVMFESASLTKSLFALLAMQEAEQGKIDLDAPIAPLLKEEPWSQDLRFGRITPRQCLCHASGLPNWQAKPMDIKFDPGTAFSYSGEGYFLLQRLIEQLEGKNMEQLFRERFFIPWGMESATTYWTPAVYAAFSEGFARDGSVRKVRSQRRVSGNAPEPNAAWSLYAWAGEYAKFLCALMKDRGGLGEAAFHEMTIPQNRADDQIAWGLGFGIPDKDPQVLWHWGDNAGFQSFAVWDKKTRDGAVVFTNSDNGQALYFEWLRELTDGAFWADIEAFVAGAE